MHMARRVTSVALLLHTSFGSAQTSPLAPAPADKNLEACGDAYYYPGKYTCYDTDFLCPIFDGQPTLRCGPACYLQAEYSCVNGQLGPPGSSPLTSATSPSATQSPAVDPACTDDASILAISDAPYENYFYSDCSTSSQVVVTSPLSNSDLTFIGPRLLIAWPAGNSGVLAFFAPQNGINGSLGLRLVNYTSGPTPLRPIFGTGSRGEDQHGVRGLIEFNSSAVLTVPILGSIRTIRDFTEGPSILVPLIQDAITFNIDEQGRASLSRRWLDNITTSDFTFTPMTSSAKASLMGNSTVSFAAGTYEFAASFNYPQLTQLSAEKVLNPASQSLITQQPGLTKALSFLSYSNKLLAGAWRFLTYFGRDSMISLLLLQPVLSEGSTSATEAVIAAVLERVNSTSGSVCHEETIGDYATYLHETQDNITSTAPICTYVMIDTDYYLPIVMADYLIDSPTGRERATAFLSTTATLDFGNKGRVYSDLAQLTAQRILNIAAPFAAPNNQTQANLARLHPDQVVGEWRDSTYGIGGGRIPFDVNCGLMPAALHAIARLASARIFPTEWANTASAAAAIWETEALPFFSVSIPAAEASGSLTTYVAAANISVPASTALLVKQDVQFHALALEGNSGQSIVRVMHTDAAFRLYLVNASDDSILLRQTAQQILAPFPVGLSSGVGLLVANPAYGGAPVYAANFSRAEYHGTVVWGWPMAMMAKGLERQLARCEDEEGTAAPVWCADTAVASSTSASAEAGLDDAEGVYSLVKRAYNHLWDVLEANQQYLAGEVWSWNYVDGEYVYTPLGAFSPTESDVRQLWSLTYLAVVRNEAYK